MEISLSRIESINKYNPYFDLLWKRDDEYFESVFIDYFNTFNNQVNKLKIKYNHKKDKKIDKYFNKIIKRRNDQEIDFLISRFNQTVNAHICGDVYEKSIRKLKKEIKVIKNMILVSEPANMRRLQEVDELVSKEIDRVSEKLHVSKKISIRGISGSVEDILNDFNFDSENIIEYNTHIKEYRGKIEYLYEYYRNNYSVKTAEKYIKKLEVKFNKLLDKNSKKYYDNDIEIIYHLVDKYSKSNLAFDNFKVWVYEFRKEINNLNNRFKNMYSGKMYNKIVDILNRETDKIIDKYALKLRYPEIHEAKLERILDLYRPEDLDIFDMIFYSSEKEMLEAKDRYLKMTKEQQNVFEMRIYEEYIRRFKGNIRELNQDIRRVYSSEYANKLVDSINKRADKYVREKAKSIGKPVPKNPWLIRKKLWTDLDNFVSDRGVKFRKIANPILRPIVRMAMKNKIVIEERAKLDTTKRYIYVPTHYFTEDAIGMFSSLDRQAYMLMGTTDQIENNPLMIAALMLGFFHVDRMDKVNRSQCVDKQNIIIDKGANFINYISGSWENSENELQPLSFSGPYRTAIEKNVEIVPVSLYLVKEDKKIYVRFGEPIDVSKYDEKTFNEMIRDTLASMHFKQMEKYSKRIETIEVAGYGKTHNLPYDQHTYYMDTVGNEYWGQYWSKPFAEEEIGVRPKKTVDEADVYSFVDNLSREKLVELSKQLSEPMLRRYERDERFNLIKYLDENYDRFKSNNMSKVKRKTKGK